MSRPGTILVTGAAAGIGLATAKALIAMNHRVAAADLDQEMLERAAEALGSGFVPMPVDLADADDTGMLVARVTLAIMRATAEQSSMIIPACVQS